MLTKAQVEMRLNQVIADVYTKKRPALESAILIPRGANVGEGTKSVSYSEITEVGMAKMVGDYSKDFPPVALLFKTKYQPVNPFGDSYSYSYEDLLHANMMNVPLERDKADLARYAIESAIDEYNLIGNKAAGVTGFLNNENVPVTVLNSNWKTATIDDIIADIQKLLDNVDDVTNGTEKPNSIIIPSNVYPALNSRRVDQYSSTRMLEYLKDTFPQIVNWYSSRACNDIGTDGANRVVLYTKDESAVSTRDALNFIQLPAQWSGAAATVNCLARTAGTVFKRPLSAIYGDKVAE